MTLANLKNDLPAIVEVYRVELNDPEDIYFNDPDPITWPDDDGLPVDTYDFEDGQEAYGSYIFHRDYSVTGQEGRIASEAEEWQKASDLASNVCSYLDEDECARFEWTVSHIGYLAPIEEA